MRRNISLFSLVVVFLGVASWQSQNGLTSDGPGRIELFVKTINGIGDHSAVWVKNLSAHSTRLAADVNSALAQETSHNFEPIAGHTTVRLDEFLPAIVQGKDDLIVRSDEDVVMIIAPDDFAIDRAEYYHPEVQRQTSQLPEVPKWVRELGAIGKSGANVLKARSPGSAPVVKGQSEINKRYVFGVGIALAKPNSSVEIRLINKTDEVVRSVVLASSTKLGWRAELGEFNSSAENFPSRVEMKALAGKAQGFLSIKDAESEETIILPVIPRERKGSVRINTGSGGTASFTNGIFDSRYSSYYYSVTGAPANVCGTLHIIRNGVEQVTPNWICTNGSGNATNGPWTGSTNQTGQSIYIEWPDSSRTAGGDYKVDDASDPSIWSNQTPGFGVPIPTAYYGGASDTQWGSGFDFTFFGWSSLYASFYNVSTSKYYDGSGYNSNYPSYYMGSVSPSAGGFSITWSVTPPPSNAHNSSDTYKWCVHSNDYFYTCFECLYFYGPR
jgi:hypothetical protein